jgi:hypothetical protein
MAPTRHGSLGSLRLAPSRDEPSQACEFELIRVLQYPPPPAATHDGPTTAASAAAACSAMPPSGLFAKVVSRSMAAA